MGIVPLCMPIIVGPAALSKIIMLSGSAKQRIFLNDSNLIVVVMTISIILGILFYHSQHLEQVAGQTTIDVISRLSYLVLACIGAEILFQGINTYL